MYLLVIWFWSLVFFPVSINVRVVILRVNVEELICVSMQNTRGRNDWKSGDSLLHGDESRGGVIISRMPQLFAFILICRNAALESGFSELGYKAPTTRKTGTTIAGMVYKVRTLFIIWQGHLVNPVPGGPGRWRLGKWSAVYSIIELSKEVRTECRRRGGPPGSGPGSHYLIHKWKLLIFFSRMAWSWAQTPGLRTTWWWPTRTAQRFITSHRGFSELDVVSQPQLLLWPSWCCWNSGGGPVTEVLH